MKLFCEINEDVQYIEEANDNGEKSLYIVGPFLQTNIANRNKRMYPSSMMESKVSKYIEEQVKPNRAFGELGHPAGPTINLERVSHMIKSLKKEGNDYIGRAKIITDNPYGAIVKNLMKEEAKLGVSSRGVGSLKMNRDGINEVQDDFHIATAADIVADPSAPDAFVRGIMESREWVWENGIIIEAKVDEYKKTIVKAKGRKQLEEAALQVFKDFLDEISRT
jgi:hypothetical protein